jgi:precorrin-3B synthase
MQSGDGLILRLRVTGGRLDADRAHAIADLAARYGNGEIDLGRRGNLQLRGLRSEAVETVQAELARLGLIDGDAVSEAIRNVVISPLSDLESEAKGDAFALARRLEVALTADRHLAALPAKFGLSIDDGGRFGLDLVPADIRLRFQDDALSIRVDGSPQLAAMIRPVDAVDAALALARAFLDLAGRLDPSPRRMAALVRNVGAERLFATAGLAARSIEPSVSDHLTAPLIGAFDTHVGVGLAFGRVSADALRLVADIAKDGLRLTPFRALLLPGVSADALPALAAAGFITTADDPLRQVVACPGAPACAASTIETRALARRFAGLRQTANHLGDDVWLHVSGCVKGCASSTSHAATLVGRDGMVDLVLDGRPTDPPHLLGLAADAVDAALRSETIIP